MMLVEIHDRAQDYTQPDTLLLRAAGGFGAGRTRGCAAPELKGGGPESFSVVFGSVAATLEWLLEPRGPLEPRGERVLPRALYGKS